jgi:hypothetical protein
MKQLIILMLSLLPISVLAQGGIHAHRSYYTKCASLHPLEGEWTVLMEQSVVTPNGPHTSRNIEVGTFLIRAFGNNKSKFSGLRHAGPDYNGTLVSLSLTDSMGNWRIGHAHFEGWQMMDSIYMFQTDGMMFHVFSHHYAASGDRLPGGAISIHRRYTFVKIFPLTPLQDDYTYVRARGEVGSATCFAVSNKGHLVTNHHVVAIGDFYHVRGLDGQRWPAKLIFSDSASDIAVLQITDTSFTNHLNIPFRCTDQTRTLGERLVAVGYPFINISGGLPKAIVGFYDKELTEGRFQCALMLNSGNSGGPILGKDYELVGVVSAGGFGHALGITANRLEELLNAHGIPHVLRDPPLAIIDTEYLAVYPIDVEVLYSKR